MDLTGRVGLLHAQKAEIKDHKNIENNQKPLPLSTVAGLLDVNRTSVYYAPKEPSDFEIMVKHKIDAIHTESPSWGSRQLSKTLQKQGIKIGRLKTKKYMQEMGIEAIYPKPNLSKPAKGHRIYPYLLRNAVISRANQAWSIDITYIKLRRGFIYLTAIIDWHSKCIVGWELDDTLSTRMVIQALKMAYAVAAPEILNSDQGSQFTSHEYFTFVINNKGKISMDGKGRWADNIPIERWFRTLKYDEVYLKDYEHTKDARKQIGEFIHKYNFVKLHSTLNYETPAYMYYPALLQMSA